MLCAYVALFLGALKRPGVSFCLFFCAKAARDSGAAALACVSLPWFNMVVFVAGGVVFILKHG